MGQSDRAGIRQRALGAFPCLGPVDTGMGAGSQGMAGLPWGLGHMVELLGWGQKAHRVVGHQMGVGHSEELGKGYLPLGVLPLEQVWDPVGMGAVVDSAHGSLGPFGNGSWPGCG